jgi:hypothetical protein
VNVNVACHNVYPFYFTLLKIANPNPITNAVIASVMQLTPKVPEQISGVTAPGLAARHASSAWEQVVVAAPPPIKGIALNTTSDTLAQWISPGSWVAS